MQCEAAHEKCPIKITLKIPLNPSTSTPSLLHAMLASQPDVKSHYARTPQDFTFEIDLDHLWALHTTAKYAKNLNSQHCKQSELHLFPKKRNLIHFWLFLNTVKNGLLPQCVDGRVEKKNYGKCRVDQKRLICSLFFQDLKRGSRIYLQSREHEIEMRERFF